MATAARVALLTTLLFSLSSLSARCQSLDDAFAAIEHGDRRAAAGAFAAIADREATVDPDTAGFAGNNACVLYREVGDYERGLEVCEAALALRRLRGDAVSIARTLNNVALVRQDLGSYAEAEAALREALALNRSSGEVEAQAINLGNLGGCAALQGRYGDALALHQEALALAAGAAPAPWASEQERVARVNLGVVLEKLGAFEDALDLYRRVLAGETLAPRHQADLLVNAGTAYRNLGDPVAAETFYRRARERYRAIDDRAGLANTDLNLGIVYHLDLDRRAEAEAAYRGALATATAIGDAAIVTQSLYYLGRQQLDAGRTDDAVDLLSRCVEAATASGSREGRWSCRGGLAAVARLKQKPRQALELLDLAIAEVEEVRSAVGDARLRAEYFGDRRSLYTGAVETLVALDREEPRREWAARALGFARRAKERELSEAIGRRSEARSPGAGVDAGALGDPAGRPLLELFLTETGLVAWLVLDDEVTLFDMGPREPILRAVREISRALGAGRHPPTRSVELLSAALLDPLEGRLPDRPLLIAPDGPLHDLPFAMLEVGRERGPLVARRDVIYLPGGALRSRTPGAGPSPRPLDLAVFAAPHPAAANASPDPRNRLLADLPPLPATEREAAALTASLGGRSALRTGERATEREARELGAAGVRVLHFATHAVALHDGGEASAVVLTPDGDDDGLLLPREIAALDLEVDLAVLAACRTQLGWREGGSGVASLTGAFLAAGAGSVIASLWDVGDEATAAFMTELYRHLRAGRRPADALRRTQIRFRADPHWNDPAVWAAFVVVGDGPAVTSRTENVRLGAGLALVLAGVALLAGLLARRRHRAS